MLVWYLLFRMIKVVSGCLLIIIIVIICMEVFKLWLNNMYFM